MSVDAMQYVFAGWAFMWALGFVAGKVVWMVIRLGEGV